MPWSRQFLDALNSPQLNVRVHLRTVRLFNREAVGYPWAIASWDGAPDPAIIAARPTDSVGTYVNPPTFSPRLGVWEVPLAGDIGWLMDRVSRGQVVELRVGFAGWELSQFERVAFGQVENIARGRGGAEFVLTIRDALSLLGSRLTTDYTKSALFASLDDAVDSLASSYTPTDTTLALNDASNFDDPGGGSDYSAVKVTPSSGDPFYLTYTGKSGNTLTGVSAAAVHSTTAVPASSSDVVQQVFWHAQHPLTIALRILCSTGTADFNTVNDNLPETHGYGIPRRYLDLVDISNQVSWYTPASGSSNVMWLSEAAQANGFSWLVAQLALTGCFLTVRQGCITARAMPTSGVDLSGDTRIGEDDIVSVDRWEAWWSGQQVEYGAVTVTSDSGTTTWTEDVATLPSVGTYPHDASSVLKTNESAWRTKIAQRLANWFCRWPESVDITCAGWRLAGLAPGDIVRLTIPEIPGRLASTTTGYRDRLSVICSVTPDWFGAVTRLQLFVLPSRADGF